MDAGAHGWVLFEESQLINRNISRNANRGHKHYKTLISRIKTQEMRKTFGGEIIPSECIMGIFPFSRLCRRRRVCVKTVPGTAVRWRGAAVHIGTRRPHRHLCMPTEFRRAASIPLHPEGGGRTFPKGAPVPHPGQSVESGLRLCGRVPARPFCRCGVRAGRRASSRSGEFFS